MTYKNTKKTHTFLKRAGLVSALGVSFVAAVLLGVFAFSRFNLASAVDINLPVLNQNAYIWENDDEDFVGGDAYDENSVIAAGNTAANLQVGSRAALRVELENIGDSADDTPLALFYDRGDGYWSRVRGHGEQQPPGVGSCTDTNFDCSVVDDGDVELFAGAFDVAFHPQTGQPWVTGFETNSGDFDLRVARYVESGGTGCSGTDAWSCEDVDSLQGKTSSIGFDDSANAWIAYVGSADDLFVARFVESGGSGCGFAATDRWDCTEVLNNAEIESTAITFDENGDPFIAFSEHLSDDVRVARFVGSGGSGCSSSEWACETIDGTVGTVNIDGTPISDNPPDTLELVTENDGTITLIYADNSSNRLVKASNVGGGAGSGCSDSDWDCTIIADNGDDFRHVDASVAPNGEIWVSAQRIQGTDRAFAFRSVGSGGNCDNTPYTGFTGGSDAWECTELDTSGPGGGGSSIEFDPSGTAWITYEDEGTETINIARYVGAGGTGCASVEWNGCSALDDADSATSGEIRTDVGFDNDGRPWIFWVEDAGVQKVATLRVGNEILLADSPAANNNDPINESHSDMTSITDTANQNSADCSTGATWNNGTVFETAKGTLNLPAGTTTAQCTEVAFIIDTTQAVQGETYRFIVASEDGSAQHEAIWRGPASIAQYPSLTISAGVNDIIAKDSFHSGGDCDDAAWACSSLFVDGASSVGQYSSFAFDAEGDPWISYSHQTDTDLYVAEYVGSGGTGCETAAWDCVLVDNTPTAHGDNVIGFDATGNPWIAYDSIGDSGLSVARYVGSGGTGCAPAATPQWSCSVIHTTGNVADDVNMVFTTSGNPVVVFTDVTNSSVMTAEYVGGNDGFGCDTATDWTCTVVDDTVPVGSGDEVHLGFGINIDNGKMWIAYQDGGANNLWVAEFVGGDGTGCESDAWTCTLVDNTGNTGYHIDLTLKPDGTPVVAYQTDTADGQLEYAEFVGTGGAGCSSPAWTCTNIDAGAGAGTGNAIQIGLSGEPVIVSNFDTAGELTYVAYVGTGGTGCVNTAWQCSVLHTYGATSLGDEFGFAFDKSGTAWISHNDQATNGGELRLAKQKLSSADLFATTLNVHNPGAATTGHARYVLSQNNAADATIPACLTPAGYGGQCGVKEVDSQFDIAEVGIGGMALFTFAKQTNDNTTVPNIAWHGQTTLAPSTAGDAGDLVLELYNFTTGLWETTVTDSTTTSCATAVCRLQGVPAGTTIGSYFTPDGAGGYFMHIRVFQNGGGATTSTFRTDSLTITQTSARLRGNKTFQNEIITPFRPEDN